MSYKEKPILKLYKYENNSFVLQAQIDDYQEVSWENNLYEAGQFSITINYNIPNASLFERGLFINFGDSYEFGEILKIQDSIGEDGAGSQLRVITGYDARYILKRRVIKNMNNNGLWTMTGKGELVIRNLIADQAGANAEEKRRLPIVNTIPSEEDAIGKEYSASEQFSNLYEVCKTIATQSEVGWRIEFDGTSLTLVFFSGEDRSQIVRFDTSYESLANGTFVDSGEAFSNAIYVGGKGQNDDRDIYEGENAIEGNAPSGLDRFECWDNQSSMTTEDEYEAEALAMLTQYGQTITLSGNGLAKCPYEYEKEYNVGDKITVAFSGKSAVVQILSVTEHWAFASYDLNFSFGKPQPDLNGQLQLILKQIQKASNKTNSKDSVRWYTIPTDTEMPASDVTYTHIGFIGDVGNDGKTFTLYRDTSGTGSKTYHVYFKQLAGSGKLTLTTGVSGASNLVLNSGTYVIIIYVDENGNITSQGMTATSTIESGNNRPVESGAVNTALEQEIENRNSAISNAINSLDVPSVGGSGKYISAISEADGKISATAGEITSTVSSGNSQPVTSGGVANYIRSTNGDSPISDCNDAVKNGFYYFRNAPVAHLPSDFSSPNYDGSLYVQAFSEYYVNQILQDFYSNGSIWVRTKFNGTWGEWKRVICNPDVVNTVADGNSNPVSSNAVYDNCVKKTDTSSNYVAYQNNKSVVHLTNINDTEYVRLSAYDIEAHNNAPNFEKVIGLRDINNCLLYSNSETNTSIKDINGDVIYTKTITATITASTNSGVIVATIANVKNFVKVEGVLKMGNMYGVTVPYFHSASDYNDFFFRYDNGNVYFRGQLAEVPAYLTLKVFYTKTD